MNHDQADTTVHSKLHSQAADHHYSIEPGNPGPAQPHLQLGLSGALAAPAIMISTGRHLDLDRLLDPPPRTLCRRCRPA